ncbi:rapamycin-insensitive companion of mTOR-like [Amphibalanus amphitrite]|uniref:rapamycin-insensitive companion of mTOR-like n=1 Tax=Amphibalanus amphitrite TaxID=1232801 RepID=UPI001C90D465|nr:rapamycin-insensitive companion of mTOR-like [Amphibalanus amphitrite]
MSGVVGRMRNVRLPKSTRRRRDSDEEPIRIDFSRPPSENIVEFVWRACQREGISRGQRLAYLNALVKVFSALEAQQDLTIEREELIYCLRVTLVNETKEVRAAGYRALRYLIRLPEDVRSIIRFQIPVLMVRSLDLILDNTVERVQALRLARTMLTVAPSLFPSDLTRCLLAITADGPVERDKLWMITLATVTQLSAANSDQLAACGGVHVLLRAVLDCYQPRAVDAVLSALFGLLSRPAGCWPDLGLLLAPLADPHYGHHALEPDSTSRGAASSGEEVTRSAQVALLSLLRSWPGLLLLCSQHAVAFRALIDSLHVDRPELRRALLAVLFELLGRELPDPSKSPETLVTEYLNASLPAESTKLYEGFVAEEARLFLPHLGDTRPDLVMNHLAVLLYVLLENGVLEALVEVVVTADTPLSLAATLLIADILHRVNELLPVECARFSNCLPTLLGRAAQCGPTERRVTEAISLLSRLHTVRRRHALMDGASVFFRQQMTFCGQDDPSATDVFDRALRENREVRVSDECVRSLLSDSGMMSSEDSTTWRWSSVHCLVKLSTTQHGTQLCAVLSKLCALLKPDCRQYWRLPVGKTSHQQTLVMADTVSALLRIDQSVCSQCGQLLSALVSDQAQFLRSAAGGSTGGSGDSSAQISANSLINTCVQHQFLLIGRVSSSQRGRELLERHGVAARLTDLVASSGWDYYVKLVVSSLDYSQGQWSWRLLERCLAAAEETKRLYCVQLLRLLARAHCPGFARWGVEMLVSQLYDTSERVSTAALQVVEEVCDYEPYLKAVVSQQPSVLSLGDGGVLLFARLLSVPAGHRMFQRANFLDHELDRWRDSFNARYVSLVETELNDALTRHQRAAGGGYGRRTGERHQTRPVHLPYHLYGQLAHHRAGFDLVRARPEVTDMIRVVKAAAADLSTPGNLHQLKAALWALGNVGRTGLGASWLSDAGLVAAVVALAAGAGALSARATACLALGLLGSTPQGAAALAAHGWQCVCRRWTERWAVDEEKLDAPGTEERATNGDLLSVSSGSSYDLSRARTASETSETAELSASARSATLPAPGRAGSSRHARSLSDAARAPVIPEFGAWQGSPTGGGWSSTESLGRSGAEPTPAAPLSPIASSGSLGDGGGADPAGSARLAVPVPTTRSRLPSVSLSLSPPTYYPSEEDAQGYATLRGLTGRLRRGESADEGASGTSAAPLLDCGRRRLASLTLDARLSRTLSGAGPPSPGGALLIRGSSRRSSLTTVKRYQLQRSALAPAYLGIALPLDLTTGLLAPPPPPAHAAPRQPSTDSEPEQSSKDASLSLDEDGVLEFHNPTNCIRCFTLKDRVERRPRNRTDTESSTESAQHVASPPQPEHPVGGGGGGGGGWYLSHLRLGGGGATLDIPSSITSVGSATSLASHEHLLGGSRQMTGGHVRSLVRREVLRLVGALSTSVGVKAAEQGLLSLKQKFGSLLRTDLCLYTEIHLLLSHYDFRLASRRFLQELFEDVMFEDVKSEALWILGRCRQERLDQTFDTDTVRRQGFLDVQPTDPADIWPEPPA